MYTVCIRAAILWGVLCNKKPIVCIAAHMPIICGISFCWLSALLCKIVLYLAKHYTVSSHTHVFRKCMANCFRTWCWLSPSSKRICARSKQVLWTEQNTWPLIPGRIMYVCLCDRSIMRAQSCPDMFTSLCLKINPDRIQEASCSSLVRAWCDPCAKRLRKPAPPRPRIRKCMNWSLRAYRRYTFYGTDVDIAIQTVIQTVGIYGTDVQTVRTLKTLNF